MVRQKVEIYEAIVADSPFHLHVPLYRLHGGKPRRVNGGEEETRRIVNLDRMAHSRLAQIAITVPHAKWLMDQVAFWNGERSA